MKSPRASLLRGTTLVAVTLLVAALPLECVGNYGSSQDAIVLTPSGTLRGTKMTSRSGRTIFAFRGLRYAQPPVGELRFKAPVPIRDTWAGVKNATEYGASCPQPSDFHPGPKSEDCLFLNVYSSALPKGKGNPRRPVIFWVHHGAWLVLSGQFGPRYMMDEDIVLVSINYRLAAFGFLSTGDSESPGNYGLKDQLLALKWVRDNIASFGGDPNLVTLYGYSAGGASVQYHMASPRSAGLFHRAISGSGSALSGWALNRDPMSLARRQARLLNCPHDESATSREIVECLRGKDAEEFVTTYPSLDEGYFDLLVHYAPVIESEGNPEPPFITEEPISIFQSGNFTQVPWMTGSTNNEMMIRAAGILANRTLLDDFDRNFHTLAPHSFYFEEDNPSSTRKARILSKFYFSSAPITQNALQEITDVYTDAIFLYGVDRSVKMISGVSSAPVYYYQFVYRGRYGHMPTDPETNKAPGPVHHDDLIYMIDGTLFPFFESGMPETIVSQRMVRMWANFAKTGNPTPDTRGSQDNLLPTKWIPHTPAGLSYMEIGEDLTMKEALRQERAAIWDQINPVTDAQNHE